MFKHFLASATFVMTIGGFVLPPLSAAHTIAFSSAVSDDLPIGQKIYTLYANQTGKELNVFLDNIVVTDHGDGTKTGVISLSYEFSDGAMAFVTITALPDGTNSVEGYEYLKLLMNSRQEFLPNFNRAIVGDVIVIGPDSPRLYEPYNPFNPNNPTHPDLPVCEQEPIVPFSFGPPYTPWTLYEWIIQNSYNPVLEYGFGSTRLFVDVRATALYIGLEATKSLVWEIRVGIKFTF